jgi:hypothetical protein
LIELPGHMPRMDAVFPSLQILLCSYMRHIECLFCVFISQTVTYEYIALCIWVASGYADKLYEDVFDVYMCTAESYREL